MFPARKARCPDSRRILWARVTVVDFPQEPVTPTMVPCRNLPASSISDQTGMPFSRAAENSGMGATPGLGTMRSAARKDWRRCPPASRRTPRAVQGAASEATSAGGLFSLTDTRAPRSRRKRHTARPVFPRPTTRTFLPLSSMFI